MITRLPPLPPLPPVPPVSVNRFFNVSGILSSELLPTELIRLGLPIDHPQFRQVGGFRFRSDEAGGVIVVEDGLISDLATIPEIMQGIPVELGGLENDDPRIGPIAWVHDKICDLQGVIVLEDGRTVTLTHTQAARILAYEGMADLGANIIQQDAVFNAVNDFGPQF